MGTIYLAYLLLTCFSLIFQGRDKEKDGKLNSQEYFNGLLDLIKRYDDVYKFTHESDIGQQWVCALDLSMLL